MAKNQHRKLSPYHNPDVGWTAESVGLVRTIPFSLPQSSTTSRYYLPQNKSIGYVAARILLLFPLLCAPVDKALDEQPSVRPHLSPCHLPTSQSTYQPYTIFVGDYLLMEKFYHPKSRCTYLRRAIHPRRIPVRVVTSWPGRQHLFPEV